MRDVPSVRIRPGTASDLAPVVEIYNHYILETPATFETDALLPEDRATWLDGHLGEGRHRIFVAAEPDGPVVGWATTSPFRPRAGYATTVESSVYCRPEAQGRGIGTRLYDALFRAIASEDLERIVAGVALPNAASVALHLRFGFRPVGVFTRIGRKFGRYWDVAWYERPARLGPDPGPDAAERSGHSIEETSALR